MVYKLFHERTGKKNNKIKINLCKNLNDETACDVIKRKNIVGVIGHRAISYSTNNVVLVPIK